MLRDIYDVVKQKELGGAGENLAAGPGAGVDLLRPSEGKEGDGAKGGCC